MTDIQKLKILKMLRDGASNKQIAFRLKKNKWTLRKYLEKEMRIMKANNRCHLVIKYLRKGVITLK